MFYRVVYWDHGHETCGEMVRSRMAKTEGTCIDEGKTWEPNIFLKRTEQNNIGYVLHVVLSQTSGIYTTSKLLRLLSGIRKMMFHTAFFFPLPKFSRDEIPKSCHIWEKDLFWVSTSNLELFQVLEQGSLTSCREPSAACDLAIWESSATKTPGPKGDHFKRIRSYQHLQNLQISTSDFWCLACFPSIASFWSRKCSDFHGVLTPCEVSAGFERPRRMGKADGLDLLWLTLPANSHRPW